jgi:PEP-CTERM motif
MKIPSLASWRGTVFSSALLVSVLTGRGQGASGTISGSQVGPSEWQYTITLTDTGSTAIESLWYAWTPDVSPNFYLPDSSATSISGQNGWTGHTVANSIQFSGGTALSTGQSVMLSYEADFSPATLAGAAHSGLSVAYEGAVDASAGTGDFTIVQVAPEPTSLALFGMAIAGLAAARRFKK